MQVPKEVEANKKYRLDLLLKANNDTKIQEALFIKCAMNFVFFCDSFGWTYDPRLQKPDIPFILYNFQEKHSKEIIECIEEGKQDFFFDKSRDMGASWIAVAIQAWGFLFHKWSQLYGTYKENYVDQKGDMDSHFERLRFFIDRLPNWMKPNDLTNKYMTISSNELGADISGDAGENFGTGGRRKVVWLDEFSYWQFDKTAFKKTRDITNCRIFWGTPNGRFNVFGKMMTNHKDYKHFDIKKKSLLWNLHPLKTLEWYNGEKNKRTRLDMATEIDLSYDDSVQGAVYKDFTTIVEFGKFDYKYDKNRKLYTSWDFGRDMTSIIWVQKDFNTNLLYFIDAFQLSDKDIDFFVAFILGNPTQGFIYSQEQLDLIEKHKAWKDSYAGHFGDPYNSDSRNVLSENTIKKQLASYGIHIKTKVEAGEKTTPLEERIRKTTLSLKRMKINEELTDFIQSITQSQYPQTKENSQSTTEKIKPIHNECSHYRTALEYFIDNEPEIIVNDATKIFKKHLREVKARKFQNSLISARRKI